MALSAIICFTLAIVSGTVSSGDSGSPENGISASSASFAFSSSETLSFGPSPLFAYNERSFRLTRNVKSSSVPQQRDAHVTANVSGQDFVLVSTRIDLAQLLANGFMDIKIAHNPSSVGSHVGKLVVNVEDETIERSLHASSFDNEFGLQRFDAGDLPVGAAWSPSFVLTNPHAADTLVVTEVTSSDAFITVNVGSKASWRLPPRRSETIATVQVGPLSSAGARKGWIMLRVKMEGAGGAAHAADTKHLLFTVPVAVNVVEPSKPVFDFGTLMDLSLLSGVSHPALHRPTTAAHHIAGVHDKLRTQSQTSATSVLDSHLRLAAATRTMSDESSDVFGLGAIRYSHLDTGGLSPMPWPFDLYKETLASETVPTSMKDVYALPDAWLAPLRSQPGTLKASWDLLGTAETDLPTLAAQKQTRKKATKWRLDSARILMNGAPLVVMKGESASSSDYTVELSHTSEARPGLLRLHLRKAQPASAFYMSTHTLPPGTCGTLTGSVTVVSDSIQGSLAHREQVVPVEGRVCAGGVSYRMQDVSVAHQGLHPHSGPAMRQERQRWQGGTRFECWAPSPSAVQSIRRVMEDVLANRTPAQTGWSSPNTNITAAVREMAPSMHDILHPMFEYDWLSSPSAKKLLAAVKAKQAVDTSAAGIRAVDLCAHVGYAPGPARTCCVAGGIPKLVSAKESYLYNTLPINITLLNMSTRRKVRAQALADLAALPAALPHGQTSPNDSHEDDERVILPAFGRIKRPLWDRPVAALFSLLNWKGSRNSHASTVESVLSARLNTLDHLPIRDVTFWLAHLTMSHARAAIVENLALAKNARRDPGYALQVSAGQFGNVSGAELTSWQVTDTGDIVTCETVAGSEWCAPVNHIPCGTQGVILYVTSEVGTLAMPYHVHPGPLVSLQPTWHHVTMGQKDPGYVLPLGQANTRTQAEMDAFGLGKLKTGGTGVADTLLGPLRLEAHAMPTGVAEQARKHAGWLDIHGQYVVNSPLLLPWSDRPYPCHLAAPTQNESVPQKVSGAGSTSPFSMDIAPNVPASSVGSKYGVRRPSFVSTGAVPLAAIDAAPLWQRRIHSLPQPSARVTVDAQPLLLQRFDAGDEQLSFQGEFVIAVQLELTNTMHLPVYLLGHSVTESLSDVSSGSLKAVPGSAASLSSVWVHLPDAAVDVRPLSSRGSSSPSSKGGSRPGTMPSRAEAPPVTTKGYHYRMQAALHTLHEATGYPVPLTSWPVSGSHNSSSSIVRGGGVPVVVLPGGVARMTVVLQYPSLLHSLWGTKEKGAGLGPQSMHDEGGVLLVATTSMEAASTFMKDFSSSPSASSAEQGSSLEEGALDIIFVAMEKPVLQSEGQQGWTLGKLQFAGAALAQGLPPSADPCAPVCVPHPATLMALRLQAAAEQWKDARKNLVEAVRWRLQHRVFDKARMFVDANDAGAVPEEDAGGRQPSLPPPASACDARGSGGDAVTHTALRMVAQELEIMLDTRWIVGYGSEEKRIPRVVGNVLTILRNSLPLAAALGIHCEAVRLHEAAGAKETACSRTKQCEPAVLPPLSALVRFSRQASSGTAGCLRMSTPAQHSRALVRQWMAANGTTASDALQTLLATASVPAALSHRAVSGANDVTRSLYAQTQFDSCKVVADALIEFGASASDSLLACERAFFETSRKLSILTPSSLDLLLYHSLYWSVQGGDGAQADHPGDQAKQGPPSFPGPGAPLRAPLAFYREAVHAEHAQDSWQAMSSAASCPSTLSLTATTLLHLPLPTAYMGTTVRQTLKISNTHPFKVYITRMELLHTSLSMDAWEWHSLTIEPGQSVHGLPVSMDDSHCPPSPFTLNTRGFAKSIKPNSTASVGSIVFDAGLLCRFFMLTKEMGGAPDSCLFPSLLSVCLLRAQGYSQAAIEGMEAGMLHGTGSDTLLGTLGLEERLWAYIERHGLNRFAATVRVHTSAVPFFSVVADVTVQKPSVLYAAPAPASLSGVSQRAVTRLAIPTNSTLPGARHGAALSALSWPVSVSAQESVRDVSTGPGRLMLPISLLPQPLVTTSYCFPEGAGPGSVHPPSGVMQAEGAGAPPASPRTRPNEGVHETQEGTRCPPSSVPVSVRGSTSPGMLYLPIHNPSSFPMSFTLAFEPGTVALPPVQANRVTAVTAALWEARKAASSGKGGNSDARRLPLSAVPSCPVVAAMHAHLHPWLMKGIEETRNAEERKGKGLFSLDYCVQGQATGDGGLHSLTHCSASVPWHVQFAHPGLAQERGWITQAGEKQEESKKEGNRVLYEEPVDAVSVLQQYLSYARTVCDMCSGNTSMHAAAGRGKGRERRGEEVEVARVLIPSEGPALSFTPAVGDAFDTLLTMLSPSSVLPSERNSSQDLREAAASFDAAARDLAKGCNAWTYLRGRGIVGGPAQGFSSMASVVCDMVEGYGTLARIIEAELEGGSEELEGSSSNRTVNEGGGGADGSSTTGIDQQGTGSVQGQTTPAPAPAGTSKEGRGASASTGASAGGTGPRRTRNAARARWNKKRFAFYSASYLDCLSVPEALALLDKHGIGPLVHWHVPASVKDGYVFVPNAPADQEGHSFYMQSTLPKGQHARQAPVRGYMDVFTGLVAPGSQLVVGPIVYAPSVVSWPGVSTTVPAGSKSLADEGGTPTVAQSHDILLWLLNNVTGIEPIWLSGSVDDASVSAEVQSRAAPSDSPAAATPSPLPSAATTSPFSASSQAASAELHVTMANLRSVSAHDLYRGTRAFELGGMLEQLRPEMHGFLGVETDAVAALHNAHVLVKHKAGSGGTTKGKVYADTVLTDHPSVVPLPWYRLFGAFRPDSNPGSAGNLNLLSSMRKLNSTLEEMGYKQGGDATPASSTAAYKGWSDFVKERALPPAASSAGAPILARALRAAGLLGTSSWQAVLDWPRIDLACAFAPWSTDNEDLEALCSPAATYLSLQSLPIAVTLTSSVLTYPPALEWRADSFKAATEEFRTLLVDTAHHAGTRDTLYGDQEWANKKDNLRRIASGPAFSSLGGLWKATVEPIVRMPLQTVRDGPAEELCGVDWPPGTHVSTRLSSSCADLPALCRLVEMRSAVTLEQAVVREGALTGEKDGQSQHHCPTKPRLKYTLAMKPRLSLLAALCKADANTPWDDAQAVHASSARLWAGDKLHLHPRDARILVNTSFGADGFLYSTDNPRVGIVAIARLVRKLRNDTIYVTTPRGKVALTVHLDINLIEDIIPWLLWLAGSNERTYEIDLDNGTTVLAQTYRAGGLQTLCADLREHIPEANDSFYPSYSARYAALPGHGGFKTVTFVLGGLAFLVEAVVRALDHAASGQSRAKQQQQDRPVAGSVPDEAAGKQEGAGRTGPKSKASSGNHKNGTTGGARAATVPGQAASAKAGGEGGSHASQPRAQSLQDAAHPAPAPAPAQDVLAAFVQSGDAGLLGRGLLSLSRFSAHLSARLSSLLGVFARDLILGSPLLLLHTLLFAGMLFHSRPGSGLVSSSGTITVESLLAAAADAEARLHAPSTVLRLAGAVRLLMPLALLSAHLINVSCSCAAVSLLVEKVPRLLLHAMLRTRAGSRSLGPAAVQAPAQQASMPATPVQSQREQTVSATEVAAAAILTAAADRQHPVSKALPVAHVPATGAVDAVVKGRRASTPSVDKQPPRADSPSVPTPPPSAPGQSGQSGQLGQADPAAQHAPLEPPPGKARSGAKPGAAATTAAATSTGDGFAEVSRAKKGAKKGAHQAAAVAVAEETARPSAPLASSERADVPVPVPAPAVAPAPTETQSSGVLVLEAAASLVPASAPLLAPEAQPAPAATREREQEAEVQTVKEEGADSVATDARHVVDATPAAAPVPAPGPVHNLSPNQAAKMRAAYVHLSRAELSSKLALVGLSLPSEDDEEGEGEEGDRQAETRQPAVHEKPRTASDVPAALMTAEEQEREGKGRAVAGRERSGSSAKKPGKKTTAAVDSDSTSPASGPVSGRVLAGGSVPSAARAPHATMPQKDDVSDELVDAPHASASDSSSAAAEASGILDFVVPWRGTLDEGVVVDSSSSVVVPGGLSPLSPLLSHPSATANTLFPAPSAPASTAASVFTAFPGAEAAFAAALESLPVGSAVGRAGSGLAGDTSGAHSTEMAGRHARARAAEIWNMPAPAAVPLSPETVDSESSLLEASVPARAAPTSQALAHQHQQQGQRKKKGDAASKAGAAEHADQAQAAAVLHGVYTPGAPFVPRAGPGVASGSPHDQLFPSTSARLEADEAGEGTPEGTGTGAADVSHQQASSARTRSKSVEQPSTLPLAAGASETTASAAHLQHQQAQAQAQGGSLAHAPLSSSLPFYPSFAPMPAPQPMHHHAVHGHGPRQGQGHGPVYQHPLTGMPAVDVDMVMLPDGRWVPYSLPAQGAGLAALPPMPQSAVYPFPSSSHPSASRPTAPQPSMAMQLGGGLHQGWPAGPGLGYGGMSMGAGGGGPSNAFYASSPYGSPPYHSAAPVYGLGPDPYAVPHHHHHQQQQQQHQHPQQHYPYASVHAPPMSSQGRADSAPGSVSHVESGTVGVAEGQHGSSRGQGSKASAHSHASPLTKEDRAGSARVLLRTETATTATSAAAMPAPEEQGGLSREAARSARAAQAPARHVPTPVGQDQGPRGPQDREGMQAAGGEGGAAYHGVEEEPADQAEGLTAMTASGAVPPSRSGTELDRMLAALGRDFE